MSQLRMKVLIISAIIAILALAVLSSPLVIRQESRAEIRKANAADAEALKAKFDGLNEDSECKPNDIACVKDGFAKCATVAGEDGKLEDKFQITKCNGALVCRPLPLVNSRGTSLVCTTQEDFEARLDQAKNNL